MRKSLKKYCEATLSFKVKKVIAVGMAIFLATAPVSLKAAEATYEIEVTATKENSTKIPNTMKQDYVTMAGIMAGLGGKKDTDKIKRSEFARLLKFASSEKNKKMSKVKTSLYKDVSKNHVFAPYIQLAVKKGWMTGYVNGKFMPNKIVTYKEAAKAMVVLLGYGTKENGSKRTGNELMEQFYNLDISDVLKVGENHPMTKKELSLLLYEALASKDGKGEYYGRNLGLTFDEEGVPDFGTLLVKKTPTPIVVSGDFKKQLPFTVKAGHIFKNGVSASENQIKDYDVLYYISATKSVYAYDKQITGTLEQVNFNYSKTQVKSVVVSGTEYELGTKNAREYFGKNGTIIAGVGDEVTLLIGADEKVAFALDVIQKDTSVTGVISEIKTKMSSTKDSYVLGRNMTVVDTKGVCHHFFYEYDNYQYQVGDAVEVVVKEGKTTITKVTQKRGLLGQEIYHNNTRKIGTYTFSPNIRIYDITEGQVERIYSFELDGVKFLSSTVTYYELKENEITTLIVRDMMPAKEDVYGLVNDIQVKTSLPIEEGMEFTFMLTVMINGKEETMYASQSELFGSYTKGSPCRIQTDERGTHFIPLAPSKVTSLDGNTVFTEKGKGYYNEAIPVYIQGKDRVSYKISYSKLKNCDVSNLKAYYIDELGKAKKMCMLVLSES